MTDAHKNADRFSGFAALYDDCRPACPSYIVDILTRYLGHRPKTVVDLGCGTALSTLVWEETADKIIGIEPSEDMLAIAEKNTKNARNIELVRAFSDATGLDSNTADLVTCSQSFHWMNPKATLREVARLLKPGGIFAAYDCDWPPACSPAVDAAYQSLDDFVDEIEAKNKKYRDAFVQYPKEKHLENIRKSGHFGYTRELVFANTEACNAERYVKVALSQGGTQAILREEPSLIADEIDKLRAVVEGYFGDKVLPIDFCYRLRIGVKK